MLLSKCIPNARLSILSTQPQIEYSRYKKRGFDVRVAKRPRSLVVSIFYILREYIKTDIIVGIYGDGFTFKKNLKSSSLMKKLYVDFIVKLLLVAIARKPLIVFPSSIGPFRDRLSRFLVRLFFNRAKVIMVREELSKKNLLELGINKEIIYEIPDVAYILPESSDDQIYETLKTKTDDVLIGINVSQLLSYESKNYINLMVKLADYLSEKATILLIPHEIIVREKLEPSSYSIGGDDVTAIKNVYSKVKNKEKIIPITTINEVDSMKSIIGKCDMFIGGRMHSIVNALSMSVPTVGIAYSQKTPGIMKMVDLGNYTCNFRTMTFEELIHKVNGVFSNRKDIKRSLLHQMKSINQRVWAIEDILLDVISDIDN